MIGMSDLVDRLFERPRPETRLLFCLRVKARDGDDGNPIDRIGLTEDEIEFRMIEIDVNDSDPPFNLLPVFILPAEKKRRAVLIPLRIKGPFGKRFRSDRLDLLAESVGQLFT